MTFRSCRALATRSALAVAALLLAWGCGGNKPAEQAAAPETAASNPSAAPAQEPAASPVPAPSTEAPEASTKPPAAKPSSKPATETGSKPAPPPPPAPIVSTLAAGTELEAELLDPASSKTSQVGDVVRAKVTKDVVSDGHTVVPAGSVVNGTVTEAIPVKKIGGAASLGLRFDTLDVSGSSVPISATLHEKGKSETGKDAGTIAGATAGGALLGRVLSKHDKTKGTLIGAAVGAAAGTGAAVATKGKEVELPAGLQFVVKLDQPITVTTRP